MNKIYILILLSISQLGLAQPNNDVFIRINQYGYHPQELKNALVFSDSPLREKEVYSETDQKEKTGADSSTITA